MQPSPSPALPFIDEVQLQAVVKTRNGGLVAVLLVRSKESCFAHVGDQLRDGAVIRITPKSVYFRQELNDPTRIERFREVVKELP